VAEHAPVAPGVPLDGFWQAMNTFKDKMAFDRMHARGECPWMLWKHMGTKETTRAAIGRGCRETANSAPRCCGFSQDQRSSA
jgi:hypothetical protein